MVTTTFHITDGADLVAAIKDFDATGGDTLDFVDSGTEITSVSLVNGTTQDIAVHAGAWTYDLTASNAGALSFSAPANDGHGCQFVSVTAC